MPIAIFISIILHISLAAAMSLMIGPSGQESEQGSKDRQRSISMRLLDKPHNSDPKKEVIPEKESGVRIRKEKLPPEQTVVDHPCENFYTGIGITTLGDNCRVDTVAVGYPAYRAGIQVGDLIISDDLTCPGRGPIGTLLTIKILRGNKALTKTLVREKICTE